MLTVTFHPTEEIHDRYLKFAVIVAQSHGRWVLCRHKQRSTWEIPGGHREADEAIAETARRELWEETGATKASIQPICVYNVLQNGIPSYGMLYYADILELHSLPKGSEIAEIASFETLPENLTYPAIQPHLYNYVLSQISKKTAF